MFRKVLLIGIILVVSFGVLITAVNASSSTAVFTLSCTGWIGDNVPNSVVFDRDNTGQGREAYEQVITDGAGTVLIDDKQTIALGSYSEPNTLNLYAVPPKYNPITIVQKSLAGNGFQEQVLTVQTGICAGLPFFQLAKACPSASGDNAVMGAMPAPTQAFWAPGKASPGVVINPGTYWVLSLDDSGQYYQILLSCQYLWVPIGSMGPSYQAPWNGQPLPTNVVKLTLSDTLQQLKDALAKGLISQAEYDTLRQAALAKLT